MGTRVGRDPRSREPVDAVVVGHGSESEVFSPGDGTVRKVRLLRPYSIDAVLDDLAKIVYHNYLFPADAYVVNGVLVYDNAGRDEYFLDLSQPLVLPLRDENGFTAAPSEEQILAALRKTPQRFSAIGSLDADGSSTGDSDAVPAARFQAYSEDFILTDFKPGANTFVDSRTGELRFVDPRIQINAPGESWPASRFGKRTIAPDDFDPRSFLARGDPSAARRARPAPKAVLFDLDGTLLDTLPGLAASVNAVLRAHGLPERTLDEVRAFVGNGVRKLVARSAEGGESRPDYETLLAEYRAHYAAHAAEGSSPYPGIPELVAALRRRGVRLAVVTNKDEDVSRALIGKFFPGAFDAVCGGNAGRPTKPDPATPRAALAALGVAPKDALYVGDTAVDADTARGAGVPLRLCSWGFRARGDLEPLGPVVDAPSEILAAFESHAESAENAEFVAGKRALRVRFAGPCKLSTPVSVPPGGAGSYSTPNTPWLYRGMTATVRGRAGEAPAGATLRAFVRHADGTLSQSEPLPLASDAPFELRWPVLGPAVPTSAILDFGLAVEGGAGTIDILSIDYRGPVSLDYGDEWNPKRWGDGVDGWINGMNRVLGAFSDDPEPQRRLGSDCDPCVFVTGNRAWGDQSLRCRFNVHAADRAGVVLRWQGMRRHYAFLFEKERVLLVRQSYGETVLAERPFVLEENRMVDLDARAEGSRLSLRVDGKLLLEADDATFATGGLGFYAKQGILGVAKPSVRAESGDAP